MKKNLNKRRNTGPYFWNEQGGEVYVSPDGNIVAVITSDGSVYGKEILPSATGAADFNLVYYRCQMALEFAQGAPLNRFSSDRRDSAEM